MQIMKIGDVDYQIAQGNVFINRTMPLCIEEMQWYYVSFANHVEGVTKYYTLLEANDLRFNAAFCGQLLGMRLCRRSPQERYEFITDLYASGYVCGAFVHIWSFREDKEGV